VANYNPDLRARSLVAALEHVQELLMDAYLGIEEEILEGGGRREFWVDVLGTEVVVQATRPEDGYGGVF
jgi:hypothetical protein